MRYFIIGAGIWGCTMARLIAEELDEEVLIAERRPHIGGNSHSFIDPSTGIECHQYGSHIFHTSDQETWDFVTRFSPFTPYRHKVLAIHDGHIYSMPINLMTINVFFNRNFTPGEAEEFLRMESRRLGKGSPANLEEKAISQIGPRLYEAFVKNYTRKQWGQDPCLLDSKIINRLPVRFNYNMDYFSDIWQGVPLYGYAALFKKMLDHPRITLRLECEYRQLVNDMPKDALVIYSGMPDELFDYRHGELEWRSLRFEWQVVDVRDFQGTTVVNYVDSEPEYTRIHEFKHYHPERKAAYELDRTVISREYPAAWRPGGEAYYPVPCMRNEQIFALYLNEANARGNIILGGRLGQYQYMDMDKAVTNARHVFETQIKSRA